LVRSPRGRRGSRNHPATRRRAVVTTLSRPAIAALTAALLTACDSAPGRPTRGAEATSPAEVIEFRTLYAANCAGCHGGAGRGGAAIALANPVYLAIAGDAAIKNVVASGVRGTPMPAFAERAGGMLTDRQIEAITSGIRSWSRPGSLDGVHAPPYAAT